MNTMLESKYSDAIMADLEYVKEFKTPLVLFTSKGQAIGLGESMSYIKIEIGLDKICHLKNIIIETKSIAKLLKKEKEEKMRFGFLSNPLAIETEYDITIATGLAPGFVENGIMKFLDDFNRGAFIVTEKVLLNDTKYWNELKALKAENGILNMVLEDIIIPLNKKLLPTVTTDKVEVQGFKSIQGNYAYVIFKTISKKGLMFETYIKILKV